MDLKKLSPRTKRVIQLKPETMRAIDEALERGTLACTSCREEIPLKVRVCPACGHEFYPPWWRNRWFVAGCIFTVVALVAASGALWWLRRLPGCDDPEAQFKLAEAFRFSASPEQLGGLPTEMLYIGEHPDDAPPETRLCYGVMLLSNGAEVDIDYTFVRDEAGFLNVTFSLK